MTPNTDPIAEFFPPTKPPAAALRFQAAPLNFQRSKIITFLFSILKKHMSKTEYDFLKTVPTNSLNAIFDSQLRLYPGVSEAIKRNDVIFLKDRRDERLTLVYGQELLVDIAANGKKWNASTLVIAIDQETDDLERLIEVVEVVKGSHCYRHDEAA